MAKHQLVSREIRVPPPQVVGGFNPFEKYASQLGLFFSIYGKIIQVFQTTNQYKLANFDKPYSFHDL